MMNALYVPCYGGELGWEIINYVPHVNYLVSKKEYKEVHVVVREGREALYPMGTHWYPISLPSGKSMGNTGPSPPANKICQRLQSSFKIEKVASPKPGMRYFKKRKFLEYAPSSEILEKWSHLPDNVATLSVRGRGFGPHKNWKAERWLGLCDHLLGHGLVPVLSGLKETLDFECPAGGIDLRGETTIADLLAIFKRSKFVVGQSTGPMHLASMCCVPHAVWGSTRIKGRYLDSWNPHGTVVVYQDCGGGFDCSLKDALRLVDKLMEKISCE